MGKMIYSFQRICDALLGTAINVKANFLEKSFVLFKLLCHAAEFPRFCQLLNTAFKGSRNRLPCAISLSIHIYTLQLEVFTVFAFRTLSAAFRLSVPARLAGMGNPVVFTTASR